MKKDKVTMADQRVKTKELSAEMDTLRKTGVKQIKQWLSSMLNSEDMSMANKLALLSGGGDT